MKSALLATAWTSAQVASRIRTKSSLTVDVLIAALRTRSSISWQRLSAFVIQMHYQSNLYQMMMIFQSSRLKKSCYLVTLIIVLIVAWAVTTVPFAMMAFLVTMANVMISAVKVNSALRASALNAARCAALALRRPICAIPVLKMVTYLHLPNCFSTKDFVPRLALLAQLI